MNSIRILLTAILAAGTFGLTSCQTYVPEGYAYGDPGPAGTAYAAPPATTYAAPVYVAPRYYAPTYYTPFIGLGYSYGSCYQPSYYGNSCYYPRSYSSCGGGYYGGGRLHGGHYRGGGCRY